MSLKQVVIKTLFIMFCISSQTAYAVERLFWDKVPLRITLPVGKERLVTFPADVKVGVPGLLGTKLRTQSNQGTVYWKANAAFDTQRIEVHEIQSNHIYLLDLKASKEATSVTPIEVIYKQASTDQTNNDQTDKTTSTTNAQAKALRQLGYIDLTRFAAQQLYAPARLLKSSPQIHRVSVARRSTTHLIRGQQVTATPVASWQSGALYITAVELKNTSKSFITLDPRHLRGGWRAATFQHSRLHPAGSESDTSAVYLISDRPFHEVI